MGRLVKTVLPVVSVAAFAGVPSARAVISFYDMFYLAYYTQNSADAPTLPDGHQFTARIFPSAGDALFAYLQKPGDTFRDMPMVSDTLFMLLDDFPGTDPTSMLTTYPAGTYNYQIQGGNLGELEASITRPDATFWSEAIPAFTPDTFNALQNVDSAFDFAVNFNSFSAPLPANLGVTFLTVYDPSGNIVFNDFFDPNVTSRVITANTLMPSTTYTVSLFFSSRIEMSTGYFGGATSILGFDRVTNATLTTVGSCPCDLNGDGVVDDSDFVLFVIAYNILDCTDPSMPVGCPSDFNGDGVVDDSDFVIFAAAYNALICP
jgi:hypothetical protein